MTAYTQFAIGFGEFSLRDFGESLSLAAKRNGLKTQTSDTACHTCQTSLSTSLPLVQPEVLVPSPLLYTPTC